MTIAIVGFGSQCGLLGFADHTVFTVGHQQQRLSGLAGLLLSQGLPQAGKILDMRLALYRVAQSIVLIETQGFVLPGMRDAEQVIVRVISIVGHDYVQGITDSDQPPLAVVLQASTLFIVEHVAVVVVFEIHALRLVGRVSVRDTEQLAGIVAAIHEVGHVAAAILEFRTAQGDVVQCIE